MTAISVVAPFLDELSKRGFVRLSELDSLREALEVVLVINSIQDVLSRPLDQVYRVW